MLLPLPPAPCAASRRPWKPVTWSPARPPRVFGAAPMPWPGRHGHITIRRRQSFPASRSMLKKPTRAFWPWPQPSPRDFRRKKSRWRANTSASSPPRSACCHRRPRRKRGFGTGWTAVAIWDRYPPIAAYRPATAIFSTAPASCWPGCWANRFRPSKAACLLAICGCLNVLPGMAAIGADGGGGRSAPGSGSVEGRRRGGSVMGRDGTGVNCRTRSRGAGLGRGGGSA